MECEGCRKGLIITSPAQGESYCSNCGLVVDQVFDYSMHWYGDKGTSYSKTTFTKAYKGLGTVDPHDLRRHKGVEISEEEKVERNFSNASHALHVIWALWQVPWDIREECAIKYRKLITNGTTHGRNTHAMAIAVTFLVCEKYEIIRDWKGLAESLNLSAIPVEKCIKACVNKI